MIVFAGVSQNVPAEARPAGGPSHRYLGFDKDVRTKVRLR
jgi:hypothetical protein